MSAALLILGLALGALAVWLVMRRDDRPSDPVAEAKAEADEIDAAAEVELDKKLEAAREDRTELERINKIKDKRKRFEVKAAFANRKNPRRESDK